MMWTRENLYVSMVDRRNLGNLGKGNQGNLEKDGLWLTFQQTQQLSPSESKEEVDSDADCRRGPSKRQSQKIFHKTTLSQMIYL